MKLLRCPRRPLTLAIAAALAPLALQAQTAAQTDSDDKAQLPVVRVKASAPKADTEGSGSYTTGATAASTGLTLSLRDTPQSLTVVTRQRIGDQGLLNLGEVLQQTSGVSALQYDSERIGFSARGFEIDNYQVDGVPTSINLSWSHGDNELDTALYDRIEIVRGATGLLTGAGSPAASVNLIRKRANSKVFTGQLQASIGSWQFGRLDADLSTPLSSDGTVRGRVVLAHQQRESYVDLYEHKKNIAYAVVDADLTPATRLSIGADYRKSDPKGTTWGGLPIWYADGSEIPADRSQTTAAKWSSWKSDSHSVFANVEHRLANGWLVKLGATRQKSEYDARLLWLFGAPDPQTGLGLGAFPGAYVGERSKTSLNLQASGPFELFGRQHELLLGALSARQQDDNYSRSALTAPATPGSYKGWTGDYPNPGFSADAELSDALENRQRAVYGAARLNLAERAKLILGARASKIEIDNYSYGATYSPSHDKVVPYAGLVVDLSEQLSAYASHTGIFKPQNERDRNGNYLDPIEGNGQELGLKAEFLDGRLNASLALFRIKQDKLAQIDTGQFVPGSNPPEQAYRAAKGAKSHGFEAEVTGQLTPAWQISAGFVRFDGADASGAEINTSAPRKQFKLFTSYRLGDLTLGGGVNWQSRVYAEVANPAGQTVQAEQKAYALLSLMARYRFDKQWALALNVDNVGDKTYRSQVGFYGQQAWGAPRNARLTASYSF